jgi:hypothetical protein
MTDKALDDLVAILDRLGPNMWLLLDTVSLERFFGTTGLAAIQAVAHLGEQHNCTFIPDQEGRSGRFARSYYPGDDND